MKKVTIFSFLFLFCILFVSPIHASEESSYVLPYPSSMPGSVFYKLHIVLEQLQEYWYFGDFGQFTYDLKESDKYLVETKTLFEYKQYLLGMNSLHKSNMYFSKIYKHLLQAKMHHKEITDQLALLHQAAQKHREVLTMMRNQVPSVFLWNPEKIKSTNLQLHEELDNAIQMRYKYL